MPDLSNLRIDGARLWDSLMEMGQVGGTPKGGCNRLALTDVDGRGRELFARWCASAGLAMTVDAMGNMFARREGTENHLPPVMMGSHLDTQPTGGKYDGVLGVLAGLEVLRSLDDLNVRTRHPIEVANWTNEEGSRFAPAMVASGVFAGAYTLDEAYAIRDRDGHRLGDELERIGYKGDVPCGGRPIRAMFELHIEQGPILEDEGVDIGVVTHGQGQRWFEVTLKGFESHAGSTPMPRRRDALVGAARVVELVNRIGLGHPPLAVATTGMLTPYPGSRNVIPGEVFLTCEFRHPEEAVLIAMEAELRAGISAIADAAALDADIRRVFVYPPVPFDGALVGAVRRAAERGGFSHRDIVSGAGHDACYIARVAPTAMIFTPCVGGVSHNEAEEISPAWASAGAQVLLHAVLETAEVVG